MSKKRPKIAYMYPCDRCDDLVPSSSLVPEETDLFCYDCFTKMRRKEEIANLEQSWIELGDES
jgi:hypothetical protein